MANYPKDPQAIRDFTWDWTSLLTDLDTTISAHAITAPEGVTVVQDSHDDTTVTARLSGGTAGQNYSVSCKVTMADGQVDERSMTIMVRDR